MPKINIAELLKIHAAYEIRSQQKHQLLEMVKAKNPELKKEDVLEITETAGGKIVYLERGSTQMGYKHLLKHADEFKECGIPIAALPRKILDVLKENQIVGYQGKGKGRPIYSVSRSTMFVAITVGGGGSLVGANPSSMKQTEKNTARQDKVEQNKPPMTLDEIDKIPRSEQPMWYKMGLF